MSKGIELLDCTLRDGAYIVNSEFGESAIKGIISKLQRAKVEIIECGWLKNDEHQLGSSFYHVPNDLLGYINDKQAGITYAAMIDWDRYDLEYLPQRDGKTLDAIRVVFPHGKSKEGMKVGAEIKDKGYDVFFQAANTLAYSDEELRELANLANAIMPMSLSIVDTFGAMYEEDLNRIVSILDNSLDEKIKLGFHSHNNQQLSFSLSMHFVNLLKESKRGIVIDSSLCGMGRGAGNATTELMVNFLNEKCNCNYDMDSVMDAIDIYMTGFAEKYSWGYSTPYFIAGMYCCHVNNIAYLLKNHRTGAKDMRNIIESLTPADRKKYDYDLLETKYIENQSRIVDDEDSVRLLSNILQNRKIVLVAPGKSALFERKKIVDFVTENHAILIAVNALLEGYNYDYLFLTNRARYEYAKETKADMFTGLNKILLSNIKTSSDDEKEIIVGFNRAIKRGWDHFDNAMICCMRFLLSLNVTEIYLAGFDGFKDSYNESYADESLPTINPGKEWNELNIEIKDMFNDIKNNSNGVKFHFLTNSMYEE